ncbi:MAG: MlaD family protein [Geminicoccaceae bacterium]
METRASYLLVGGFVLIFIAGLAGFVIWLARAELDQATDRYEVAFMGSVSGLQQGSQVRYRGLLVGRVTSIQINQDNVEEVVATLEVDSGTPIKTDTVAALEYQGITGIANVQLSGGTHDAPDLLEASETDPPRITAGESALQRLFTETPNLLETAVELAERGNMLMSDQNLQAIETTLASVQRLAEGLAARQDELDRTLVNVSAASEELDTMVQSFTALSGNLTSLAAKVDGRFEDINEAVDTGIVDLRAMAQSFTDTSDSLDGLIEEIDQPWRDFSQTGLYDLTKLIQDSQTLVESASRIVTEFERDPALFLFGSTSKGFVAQ